MSVLTLASDPQDAQALDDAEAHHARLAGELAVHVKTLLAAVDRDPDGDAARPRTALVSFCDRALLPHAGAEEAALYPAARAMPEARLLVESLTGEHRRLTALVDALRSTAPDPVRTAADAGALQVLFEEHVAKENGLVLPLLAMTPEVSLAELLGHMHHALTGAASEDSGEDGEGSASGEDGEEAGAAAGRAPAAARRRRPNPSWTYGRYRTPCATPRSSAPWTPSRRAPRWCWSRRTTRCRCSRSSNGAGPAPSRWSTWSAAPRPGGCGCGSDTVRPTPPTTPPAPPTPTAPPPPPTAEPPVAPPARGKKEAPPWTADHSAGPVSCSARPAWPSRPPDRS
ncbi:hemerythrin HHE cation binding domain-containing protein [Streptomyces laurentii]|uniref:Hemerythrin HHE cation binding domain-containing protein n=1 Tax=Streptomyces laurentii TaxID=39478 RepID=A0A160P3L8_STRLU|nr:hemerythrin HHE cation binding domain-containing protein [Streptomyces laurentii]